MTDDEIRAFMREMGRKGGKVSGSRRMQMPIEERRRIASIAARARWGTPADVPIIPNRHGWPWPLNTRFEVYLDGAWHGGWIVTRLTAKTVWHYKPEYDGPNRFARRQRIADFEREIDRGTIRRPR